MPPQPPTLHYVRFQSPTRSPHGHFPGIFALANGLTRDGRLTPGRVGYEDTTQAVLVPPTA
ncbi:hypothetical protein [Streptomyces niveus]|uniref:hypothetical protein n=1 Tax=Streptomyces niveus TaxID=193462 RepID=UPI0003C61ABA|nr:hypothetical protein [Streptomyces niveus]EST25915.1 hypothetical protein M877_21010 [Streptomyces niveus NCIMB 11891]